MTGPDVKPWLVIFTGPDGAEAVVGGFTTEAEAKANIADIRASIGAAPVDAEEPAQ